MTSNPHDFELGYGSFEDSEDEEPRAAPYDTRAPLLGSLRIEPGLYLRFRRWLAEATPYSWRERARRRGFWRRRAIPAVVVLLGVIVAVFAGNLGISAIRQVTRAFASAAAFNAPAQQPPTPGSIIISPLNTSGGTPTPGPTVYDIGVWTSDANPNGTVTVYMRVSQSSQAVPGAKVSLLVSFGSGGYTVGPLTTDGYGMASTQINVGGAGGAPVFLTATTTFNNVTFSGSYTFVTSGGVVVSNPGGDGGGGGGGH